MSRQTDSLQTDLQQVRANIRRHRRWCAYLWGGNLLTLVLLLVLRDQSQFMF